MEDKWQSFLDQLRKLHPNYGASDLSLAYRELQNSIEINEVIGYDNRSQKYTGAFHFALSVQILSEGATKKFIPFVFVLNGDEDNRDKAKAWVNESIDKKSVKYNYTDFFDDVRKLKDVQNVLKGEELSRISFQTNITEEGYTISNIFLNSGHHRESMNNGSPDGICLPDSKNLIQLLKEKGKTDKNTATDFIHQLSVELYKKKIGIDTLYYTIYGLDGDYKTGERLTHILMISEDPNEIKDFCAKDFFDGYIRKIRDISSCIRTRYTYDLIQKNKWEALKSAVSAIMSRNMSHNLGSHYLYYTKKHLERLADVLSNEFSPDIRGAAMVLEYTQGRMDYLATIISNDKYPYGAVNFKSQLFDALTIDDFSKRHFTQKDSLTRRTVNYLLSNLIRSEDFTRPSIMANGDDNPDKLDLLKLQIKYAADGKHFECFTGTNFELDQEDDPDDYEGVITMASEAELKRILSNIYIALPGGNMSCHAFFNIVENFIRNSAKYLREDFHTGTNNAEHILTTNIAIRYTDEKHDFLDIIIYDDKENGTFYKLLKRTEALNEKIQKAYQDRKEKINSFFDGDPNVSYIREVGSYILSNLRKSSTIDTKELLREAEIVVNAWKKDSLFEQMRKRLESIKILDKDNALNKENKGLKEMIFSSAWISSYKFKQGQTFTDVIYDIQKAEDADEKLKLIQYHCFTPVLVIEESGMLSILKPEDNISDVYLKPACFGISFTLPLFKKTKKLDIVPDEMDMIQNCLATYADIIKADLSIENQSPINIRATFPRVYPLDKSEGKTDTQIFREILRQRFPDFDKYWLSFGGKAEASGLHDDDHHIKFDHHMKDHVANKGGLESQLKYAYSDSVSGGNFTKTMNELFDNGINQDGTYKSIDDEYFALKIKESALTRVTIIDERLSDSMEKDGTELELSLKNIRLLNYKGTDAITSFTDLFKGNAFKDETDNTHFLSIHLGLVEKIIQSTEFSNFVGNIPLEKKAEKFMSLLRDSFGNNDAFISIHSGRGNFSAELEGPLAGYPFITMSSLESAFNNSKFLLTQLLYNTAYIGKGKINHQS